MPRKRPALSGAFAFEAGGGGLDKNSPAFKALAAHGSPPLVHNKHPSLSTLGVEKPYVLPGVIAIRNKSQGKAGRL